MFFIDLYIKYNNFNNLLWKKFDKLKIIQKKKMIQK